MSIAKVVEVIASSPTSFEHAVTSGVKRASKTLDDIKGAWIKEQSVVVKSGKVVEFRVTLKITFLLKG